VPIPSSLVSELRRHKLASRFSADTDPVFASRRDTRLSHRNVTRRGWEPASDAAGLPETLRFHDLRHACASRLLARGVDVAMVSSMLGHANIAVTMSVYSHLVNRERAEDAVRRAMEAIQ
jgi:integrase